MFSPNYQLTAKLLSNIAQIERFYGQIEALRLPEKLQLNLQTHNLVKSSYASNKIEGNPLTLPEVTNLLLDDRVPVNRDEKEVVNYFEILSKLSDYKKESFSLDLIIKFHNLLMQGVDKTAGIVRNVKVVIGKYSKEKGNVSLRVKHDPPHHTKVEINKDLLELCEWVNKAMELPVVIKSGIFHHQFVYIHPFEDGNGRVGRILTALIFLKHNYLINKYFVLDDYYDIDRQLYSDSLHLADRGNKTAWLEYYSDGVKYSLQSALFKVKEAIKTLSFEDKPTPKEKEVLDYLQKYREVASQDIAKVLKVTRQQAHNLLSSLVKKGLLSKKGSTKSSFYYIK